ncbi:MAG TPA: DUF2865 domain-containing protein [Devosia sp.]|nr:DUF2865 domain-containing protein [Devosia sp.]
MRESPLRRRLLRLAILLAGLFVALDAGAALAQSAVCGQLGGMLAQFDRNPDLRNAGQAADNLRALQADERNAEQAYLRTGCQDAQQKKLPQTQQCRGIARQILSERDQIAKLSQSADNGSALAAQRQQIVQQMARYGCGQPGSGAIFSEQSPRRNFLQQLFGAQQDPGGYGDDEADYTGQQVEDPFADENGNGTIRTVCVRLSDGYYWPISYATLPDYIPQDQQTCQAECPTQQVELYYYQNPGQGPEQMVSVSGEAYTSLPTAFAYRKQFDLTNGCKPQEVVGQISVDHSGGKPRTVVSYAGQTFPLPVRDPRATLLASASTPAAAADEVADVPLPRPRPDPNAATPLVAPTAEPVISAPSRTVKVGDKLVRVVGPDTPYAPATLPPGAG